jgi:hypothetical protein
MLRRRFRERYFFDILSYRMDRMDRIARRVAREALMAMRLSWRLASEWEAPKGDRKTWRKERPGGGYEYRAEPPEDKGKGEAEGERPETPAVAKQEVGGGFFKVGSGKDFGAVMERVKKANPHGASVELKTEYPDSWKLLTNEAEDATVAVTDDGDVVSVAKAPGSKEKGWAVRAVQMAAKMGGRKLDCFDTALPHLYAKGGMRAVAKMKFDDQYASEGWDYDQYKDYNGGRPAVVFMVFDGKGEPYDPESVPEVDSYEKGVGMQDDELEKLEMGKAASDGSGGVPEVSEDTEKAIVDELMKRFGWSREKALEEYAKL